MSAPDRQQLDVLLARIAHAGLGPEAERLREGIAELELYARAAGSQIERLDATVTRVRNALDYCDRGSATAILTALNPATHEEQNR
ncbi:hypothetical protein [Streptomyces sp. NRRL F-5630]|uniref:hypothetical protein n=1 Tax=Streptomyces sp. NRRL F-5630 TaxID=1463864 RepID=UPI003EB7BEAC